MATTAGKPKVNKGRTCSICLEPFRGRQPKILSCFHTFCSPCLDQLVQREARQRAQVLRSTQGDGGPGQRDLHLTLKCPTCRTCIPVPPGGVNQFQDNFYLEEEAEDDPSPLLCDLCEEGQKAEFQCANCIPYLCGRCRRSHDKLCKSPAVSLITDTTGSAGTSSHPNADLPENINSKIGELTTQLQDLSARYTQNEKVTAGLLAQNAKLFADVTDLQKETTSLKQELTSQRREFVSLRDKHCLLSQENQQLGSDLRSLQSDHDQLQTAFKQLQSDHDQVQTTLKQLQSDHDQVQTTLKQLQSDHDQVQTTLKQLQSDHDQVQTTFKQLQSDHDQVQTTFKQLQSDHNQVQTALKQLQSDHDQVQTTFKQLQSDHDQGETKQTKVQVDVDQLQMDQSKLTSEVDQLKDMCNKDNTAIAGLETRLNKVNVQVAFNTVLRNDLTVTQPQTIVCDYVMANVGDAYNRHTGIFTAPVSGTYCFMATSSPDSDDDSKVIDLHVVMGEKVIGGLRAWGRGRSTSHGVAHVQAGQTVRLKSYHGDGGEERTFAFARFTGMLLQPDM